MAKRIELNASSLSKWAAIYINLTLTSGASASYADALPAYTFIRGNKSGSTNRYYFFIGNKNVTSSLDSNAYSQNGSGSGCAGLQATNSSNSWSKIDWYGGAVEIGSASEMKFFAVLVSSDSSENTVTLPTSLRNKLHNYNRGGSDSGSKVDSGTISTCMAYWDADTNSDALKLPRSSVYWTEDLSAINTSAYYTGRVGNIQTADVNALNATGSLSSSLYGETASSFSPNRIVPSGSSSWTPLRFYKGTKWSINAKDSYVRVGPIELAAITTLDRATNSWVFWSNTPLDDSTYTDTYIGIAGTPNASNNTTAYNNAVKFAYYKYGSNIYNATSLRNGSSYYSDTTIASNTTDSQVMRTDQSGTIDSDDLWLAASFGPAKTTINVTFDANTPSGCTVSGLPSNITGADPTSGVTISSSAPTCNNNYVFRYWEAKDTGGRYNPGDVYYLRKDLPLKAVWGAPSTVTIYDGYSTGSQSATKLYGQDYTVPSLPSSWARTGYNFTGWNTKQNGTGTSYAPGATYSTNSNLSLYAQWSVIPYTITYDANGGSDVLSQSYTIETNLTLRGASSKTGYTFAGWKLSTATGNWAAITYSASENIGTGKHGNLIDANKLVAQWTVNSYPITYSSDGNTPSQVVQIPWNTSVTINNNGGSGESSFTVGGPKTISNPTKTGYTFNGYTYDSSSNTFTAQWTVNSYTLTVVSSNTSYGTVSGGGTKDYNSSCTIVATPVSGYKFTKWTFTGAKTGESTTATTTFNMPVGNVTATATFEPQVYSLSFNIDTENKPTSSDGDGGNIPTTPATRSIVYNTTYGTLPGESTTPGDPDNWEDYFDEWKWDYKFKGWYTSTTDETRILPSTLYNVAGNQTLYARWEKELKSYTATWKDWDGTVLATTTVPAGDTPVYPNATPSQSDSGRPGYEFVGWSPVPSSIQDNGTYIAEYQVITYDITYHSSGDMTHSNPDTYTVEDTPIALSNPTRSGYKFIRWTDNAEGTGSVTSIPSGSTGDTELWAWFVPTLSDFEPVPDGDGSDNSYFGLPDDLDDTLTYELKLSVAGDRGAMTNFVLDASEGEFTTTGWQNTIDKDTYGSNLIDYLDNNVVFPMDVWRCVIRHPVATLKVELKVYNGDVLIGSSDSISKNFEINDVYKPRIHKVSYAEGVKSIDELNLFTETSTRPRYIGNSKSCVLVKVDSTNYENGNEILYGAVPTKLQVLLNSEEDSYSSGKKTVTYSSETVEANIEAANVTTAEEQVYEGEWKVVSNDPFPSISVDITAKLRIKIFDTRHNG